MATCPPLRRLRLGALALLLLLPARARAGDAREQIDKLIEESTRAAHPYSLRARFGREAATRIEKLLRGAPDDVGLHYQAAQAYIAAADEDGPQQPIPRLAERAAGELLAVRRLDAAGARDEDVSLELALLLSKRSRFEESLVEYDRALAAHALAGPYPGGRDPVERSPGRAALVYGNSAETLMALGRLPEAIARYRVAVELTPSDPAHLASLPLWGLAIALDRDGQVSLSRAAIKKALSRDPGMTDLDNGNVFFLPAGEKLYYQALGYLVSGKNDAAAMALRRYLDTRPAPRWAARARSHLTDVTPAAPPPPP